MALVVGDGVLRPEIDRIAREQGWRDRLVCTGHAELDDMPEYIRAMDCLVLPSRTVPGWKEQFGLVLAQAMASGVPVIGSDSGAIPEVIGEAGLLFHEGDVRGLSDGISRLLEDAAERAELRRRGLERTLALYSASGLADQSYSLFRSLLSG
jgi:glycosyltransferase involved in cell wall biosynthesis